MSKNRVLPTGIMLLLVVLLLSRLSNPEVALKTIFMTLIGMLVFWVIMRILLCLGSW